MDTLIIWTATQYFTDPTYIQNAIERDPKTADQADDDAEAARLETLIRKLERQRDKAVANSLDPDLGDSYKPHVKRLTEEMRAAQWDLTNIKAKLSKSRQKQDIVDMAAELRDKFFEFADPKKWTTQERKTVLIDTVERITLLPKS